MFDLEYLVRIEQDQRVLNSEADQLIREARLASDLEKDSIRDKALAALGRRLSAWGEQLQEHYDSASELPVETPFQNPVRE